MSHIDDPAVHNIWGSNEYWSSSSQTGMQKSQQWPYLTKYPTNFSKANGIVTLMDAADVNDENAGPECGSSLSWAAVGSVLHDVDLPSIWSAPKLSPSNGQNLCLSEPARWTPVSASANDVDRASIESWDSSRDPLLFPVTSLDQANVWKAQLRSTDSEIPETISNSSATAVLTSTPTTCTQSFISNATSSSGFKAETGPQKIFTSIEDSSSTNTLSTEQLCDHLINSNDGWGSRPVDQSTPWDSSDGARTVDNFLRSGITTPTPASRPEGNINVTFNAFRTTLQNHTTESNVWTNEPPTGTAIWEMHYENSNLRNTPWPASLICSNPSLSNNLMSVNPLMCPAGANTKKAATPTNINRAASNRPWDQNEKFWNTPVSVVGGRPVLGSARATASIYANPTEELNNWGGTDLIGINNNGVLLEGNKNPASWDSYSVTSGAPIHWSTSSHEGFPASEEQRRFQAHGNVTVQDRMSINPLNNTYRADSVKYLMNHGFKKEEALPALIECNMDPERALHELQERYSGTRSVNLQSVGANFQTGYGNMNPQFPNAAGFTQSSQQLGNGSGPTIASTAIGSNVIPAVGLRGKPVGSHSIGANPASTQMLTMAGQPNPQLIRQQLTQQVRTALNLPLPPHPLNGSAGTTSGIGVAGTSLLGQPPPPLLNGGSNAPLPSGLPSAASGQNFLSAQNRNAGPLPPYAPGVNNHGKRSARQMTIITAIQDLQKKHQSIQQQIMVYRSNAAMCSQPQYADLFTELQGQMHQIEAQLKAKQAQLNIAYAQDCAAAAAVASSTLSQSVSPSLNDPITIMNPNPTGSGAILNPNQSAGAFQQNRPSQEQLVQQLMELRLRPNGSTGGAADGESEFPTIGTWTPYKMNSADSFEKMSSDGSGGPRSVTGQRSGVGKPRNQSNWSNNTWQPTNHRAGISQPANWPSSQMDNVTALSHLNGAKSGGVEQQATSGPWLLIQPIPNSGLGSNLSMLHNLLCHYGLTYFHALNPATGSVLVRLQSPEYAFQMMRALGDRLTVESVTDPEKLLHLQRGVGARDGYSFNPLGDIDVGAPNWSSNCDPSTSVSASPFPTKKPNTGHIASRLGVMVTGNH